MALPLIGIAARALLKKYGAKAAQRYGLKSLGQGGKSALRRKAARDVEAKLKRKAYKVSKAHKASHSEARANAKGIKPNDKQIASGVRKQRAFDVGKNVVVDASSAGLLVGSLIDGKKIDDFESKSQLEQSVKSSQPQLWRRYRKSEFSDIGKYLKANGYQ